MMPRSARLVELHELLAAAAALTAPAQERPEEASPHCAVGNPFTPHSFAAFSAYVRHI